MLLETRYFGEINIEEDRIISFDEGLPGFEDKKKFVILSNYDTEEPVPFMWMQSVEDPNLAFVVSIPFYLRPDYEFDVPGQVCDTLGLSAPEQAGVYSICRISGSMDSMTFNLKSPIVVNVENRKAVQVVLSDTRYTTHEIIRPL